VKTVSSTLSCIGVDTSGNVSLLRDLFGFSRGQLPDDPTGAAVSVSLQAQLRAMSGRHVHINVITVGFDALPTSGQQTAANKVDYAVHRTRTIFAAVSLGVGRVEHYAIPAADSAGRDDIGSEGEADDLSDEWSVPNNGVDAFVVRTISDTDFVGISPRPGDCDKDGKDDGLVAGEINRAADAFSRTFAHEIGHFLNLPHNHGDNCPTATAARNNLMAQTRCIPNNDTRGAVQLTSAQGTTMRGRCQTRPGCP
jgi:hypothetical protein